MSRCYCCGCSPNAPPDNSVPSGSTTLRSIPTGVPFLLGTKVIVIWSPGCNVSRDHPALLKTAGREGFNRPVHDFAANHPSTSRKTWQWGLDQKNSVTVPLRVYRMLDVVIRSAVVREHRNADSQKSSHQAETLYQLAFHVTPHGAVPRNPVSKRKEKTAGAPAFRARWPAENHLQAV